MGNEKLNEVLIRVQGINEDEATEKVNKMKSLLESGSNPESVLVEEFGTDASYLEKLLDPMSTVNA